MGGVLTLLGGAAVWRMTAWAQLLAGMPVIGFLGSESADPSGDRLRGFHQGLAVNRSCNLSQFIRNVRAHDVLDVGWC